MEITKLVTEVLSAESGIQLAFLFGSAALQRLRPDSDIDIAVQFETKPDLFNLMALRQSLEEKLHREVDLVALNDASPILRMQVLKHGVLIHDSDRKYYHQFFTDTIKQYDDLKRVRKVIEENMLKGRIYG